MVTVINRENPWAKAAESFGSGLSQGYTQRSDESALKQSIEKLGPNPNARDVLNAITGTKTYSNEAKQQALKNFMGVAEFEETQRATKKQEELKNQASSLKNDLAQLKAKNEAEKDLNDALTLIDASELGHDEKEALRNRVKEDKASFNAIKEVLKPNKEAIKNKEEQKEQDLTQKAFDDLVNLIPNVGRSGILTSKLGGDTAKAYAKFTSLNGALEALLVDKVSRGALSNARFYYIKNDLLPQPSDSQSEIKGKLEALATILELDASKLTGEEKPKKSENKTVNERPSLSSFERK